MKKMLYITGSFPRLGDGIGDAAGRLYDAIDGKAQVRLVTTDVKKIKDYIVEHNYKNVLTVPNWKIGTIVKLVNIIRKERIQGVVIEYAGNGYRKDFGISMLPLFLRIINIFSRYKVKCHLRLHEYSQCRIARKMFTYPLVWFSHSVDTPSYVEYKVLSSRYGNKVKKTMIGSNFDWRKTPKERKENNNRKISLAFFGCIYPGKGVEKLLDIWKTIESQYPDRFQYQLLGGFPQGLTDAYNNYQLQIDELIEKKGLKGKIEISGFLPTEEMESLIDQVDIAILPYEDGLTLRRGSFLAFLGRQVAIVTSAGDEEATKMFKNAIGVSMCKNQKEMIEAIAHYSENEYYFEAGLDNRKFFKAFEWESIARKVISFCDR